jgi:outer membrane receptor protein involved in Fe transport
VKHTKKHQASQLPRLTRLAALMATSSFAAMMAGQALAQDTKAADAAKDDVVGLDRVVVTASSQAKSKMRSSVSVTDIDQDQIKDFAPRTEAEVLLLIPGIRTDATAGPGGNSNISVRGLPIASGGSKYVQLQEDGLPTVQFGDMNFSNNDYWIRFDNNVDSIQTLRGGSSSIFASQAPGAVINYISKTGKEQGGSVGLSRGLNYNETRVDGDYGSKLAPDMYYHIGGYYREGEGARNAPANSLNGYQLKGNLTKEFNSGKGYFRVNFKLLNEHAPTTPQTFLNATQNGTNIGGFSRTPGYDGTRDSQYSIYNSSMTSVNPVTRSIETTSLTDGISVNSKSLGFEFHNELANGWSVDDKFRKSSNSGAFQAQFWNVQTLDNMISNFGGGATEGRYANGPLTGQVVSTANLRAGLVSQSAAINTQTPDMGNLVNDLSVNKKFNFGEGTSLDTKVGFFHSRQNVVQRWAISERVMEAAPNGALIDVYAGAGPAGVALTTAGLTGYNNQWGACCARDINANFTTDAPYLSLSFATGNLDIDAGVRQESFSANGTYAGSKKLVGGVDVNGDGVKTGAENNVYISDTANPGRVNYRVNYTNFSFGANYRILPDLSVFGRYSEGHRAIADRLLFSANIDSVTGQLTAGGKDAAVAPVKQAELGVKYRGKFSGGGYGVAATFFHSTTNEFDYDQTRQDNPNLPNYQGPKLNVVGTKADGLELETSLSAGNFGINANLTYTDEKISSNLGNPAAVGKTPGGVPKVRFTISPRYAFGNAVVGATFRGQGKVFTGDDNKNTIDGHVITTAFANYDFGNGLIGSLNVNNLFDTVACAGGGGFVGGVTGGSKPGAFGCGVETGRTIGASVKYSF